KRTVQEPSEERPPWRLSGQRWTSAFALMMPLPSKWRQGNWGPQPTFCGGRSQYFCIGKANMPRGDKSSYTDKQKRQAEHIEEGYEHRGVGKKEAERRAWATVNKETGGG